MKILKFMQYCVIFGEKPESRLLKTFPPFFKKDNKINSLFKKLGLFKKNIQQFY